MKRRTFLKAAGAVMTSAVIEDEFSFAEKPDHPNILVIITDQQFADAMSCAIGRKYIHTPNMDALADQGMRFTRAYSPNPLCVPARASMFTGRYPHETGIQTNTSEKVDPQRFRCMGTIFKAAGYDTGFFGKWHMPFNTKNKSDHGFDTYVGRPGIYSAKDAAEFIANKRNAPFLAVASLMNPHNICEWSRGQKLPGGPIGDPPPPEQCPPLKPNIAPPTSETDIIAHMRKAYHAHHLFPVGDFSTDKWRQYRWAYYRLTEKVDKHVGTLIDALNKTRQRRKTVVIFLSDHGECHGAHRWNQKTVFYEESARVPLIISWKGRTPKGTSDALANTGVDLLPTICDFAMINRPADLPGKSLKNQALANGAGPAFDYVVVQNHLVQCEPVNGVLLKPQGRMLRTDRYKYCVYDIGQHRESLVDMQTDPHEMTNLARKSKYKATLTKHRSLLRNFARKHNDQSALAMLESLPS